MHDVLEIVDTRHTDSIRSWSIPPAQKVSEQEYKSLKRHSLHPAILCVNKQLYSETIDLLYADKLPAITCCVEIDQNRPYGPARRNVLGHNSLAEAIAKRPSVTKLKDWRIVIHIDTWTKERGITSSSLFSHAYQLPL